MRVAVLGGGAAGMMCAATINELNPAAQVFLIEKNEVLGKKVLISGGGRCNVTTGINDVRAVLAKYPRGAKFLTSCFYNFPPPAVCEWFESHGVPLKCEEDLRVFPASDNGHDIVRVFERIFEKRGTTILFGCTLNTISFSKETKQFTVAFKNHGPMQFDKVVLAIGGQAYRHTGSTGDGYSVVEALGHRVTPLAASLNSFITKEKWPRAVSGLSLTRVRLSAVGTERYNTEGPFVFTHVGMSGPAVFALSSRVAFEKYTPQQPLVLTIDFVPDKTDAEAAQSMREYMAEHPKKQFVNTLHLFVPRSLADICITEYHVSAKHNAEVSNAELAHAIRVLKYMPLNAIGRGAGDEFVTAGGVELSEIHPDTLESKIVPGLYFAGEIMNVDGYTGGFNLQASWATGRAAGKAIAG